jgi:hypothetical protein
VGVNRVPPGFARSRNGAGDPLLAGLPAGSLRTLLTSDVGEPIAASLGRSTIRRERRPYAVSSWGLIRSVGRRARPPSSGRSTRQCRTVKRSRRPPGATRRVPGRSPTSTHHPEPGEAGRGQRLIAHTRQEHPVDPLVRSSDQGCPPGEGLSSFDSRWCFWCGQPGCNRRQHQSLCQG